MRTFVLGDIRRNEENERKILFKRKVSKYFHPRTHRREIILNRILLTSMRIAEVRRAKYF